MENLNNKSYHENSKINNIQFGVLSNEMILKLSTVEVTEGAYYDSNGDPKINGLFDPRMGVTERGKRCKTCEQDYITCPGHLGHINLAKPVFNLQFEDAIMKISKMVCVRCSKLLVNKNHSIIKNLIKSNKDNKQRFNKLKQLILNKKIERCGIVDENGDKLLDNGGCGAVQPTKYLNKLREGFISFEWKSDELKTVVNLSTDKITQNLTPEMVLLLFKKISAEDAEVMGFNKKWCLPHWLIFQNFPVIPPCDRPSVRQYNGQRCEDDITQKYNDIIKHNNELRNLLSSSTPVPEQHVISYTNMVQYHISALMNNNDKKLPISYTRSGRPIKSIAERLKGKDGRVRSNLMGKRVDFSARSVIGPDANLDIGKLGVPKEIAMNLTYPEIVNKYNITAMYKLIKNGNKIYPGAKSIKSIKDDRLRLIEYCNQDEIVLEYGDIINRHLQNDDYVLFNRQPSLHKMSMMAHRIQVMPGKTFRLNTDVCKPYNADFDGDEMNMHVPQSIQTLMELKHLASVPHHFISPSDNKPIIKPTQDNLLGVFKLTKNEVYLTQNDALHLLAGTQTFNGVLPEPEVRDGKYIRWTGKQIYSIILPSISLSLNASSNLLDNVIIEKGILKQGQINGNISGLIMHIIHNEFGYKETERYINDLKYLISRYLIKTGFSVGVSDLVVHDDIGKFNKEKIEEARKEEKNLFKKVHLNILEKMTGNTSVVFEGKVAEITSKLSDTITSNTMKTLNLKDNRILNMVVSGAKGKKTNIQQMMCLLGQQTVDGSRIPIGFTDRTLPHYPRYENGMESRGFIANNFIDGLNPMEFFFHAMAGREGLIDTAVKTASSGYLQRKLVKSMEDLKTYHDASVRDNNNDIIEFMYGCDGFESIYLEKQKTSFVLINQEKLYKDYLFRKDDNLSDYILKKTIANMNKKYPGNKWFTKINEYNKKVQKCLDIIHVDLFRFVLGKKDDVKDYKPDLAFFYPVNFKKLIEKTIDNFDLKSKTTKSDMSPIDVFEKIEELIDFCKMNNEVNNIMKILVYDYLSPKRVLRDYKFNAEVLNFIISHIKLSFSKAKIEAGEMVGPLAGQSIGEKSTQLTLNTFHLAGVADKGKVTQGVPRLNELIKVTKKPKQPSNIIYLNAENKYDKDKATRVKNSIEQTKISEILLSDPAFYFEKTNNLDNVLEEDKEFMKFYEVFSELDPAFKDIPKNPWVVRLEFNRKEMIYRNVSMQDIHQILKIVYPNSSIMYSDDNSSKLIFRLRIQFESKNNVDDDFKLLKGKVNEIKQIIIKGVDNIEKVYISELSNELVIKGKETKNFTKIGETYCTKEEYYLRTKGVNLFDLLMLKDVDSTRTFSIDMNEMNMIFGIEAGKFIIEQQFREILESSNAMTSPRHISLLCNKMSHIGEFMSVDRHGINKEDIGPLAKCSFEETTDQLKFASLFGNIDYLKGVSANIMVGQIPECGTGNCKILLDEEYLNEQLQVLGIKEDDKINIEEEYDTNDIFKEFEDQMCMGEDDQIRLNMNAFEKDNLSLSNIPKIVVE
tara:strand:- start:838 stop:5418 length:4581 start_codon:yes stop_codon:yes gene_type:complete